MTTTTLSQPAAIPARPQWPRLLMACPPQQVRQLANALALQHRVDDIQLPQSGLALLKLRDSAQGDPYFPGEIPLATARVRVSALDGAVVEGAAQLLDDRATLARAIAVIDAVIAGQLQGHEAAFELLAAGAAQLAEQAAQRRALLSATRVDFSLLGTTEDEQDD